ncbi:calcium homeostasis modulator protein 1 isoform X2 [Boleophthalmus pectinirostris]|nr:calcium homeostasis modulator protein 1 isoform X2 [Boleophthalmus pectinirostris]
MDKFRMMFQFLQSNQESFMNGICGIMALASAQLYSVFEFSCPCMPEYNYAYSMGLLFVPPLWFFLLGFVMNNNVSVLAEEWRRPVGSRRKDPTILRYMFCSMTQRSLIAPAVWFSVTLMHGRSFLCAFSTSIDIDRLGNFSVFKGMSEEERIKLLARIPCDDDVYFEQHKEIRMVATRYMKCISQACGWMLLLMMTFTAFLIRGIRPCFTQAAFLKTKYWSHYVDIERKMFDETCKEHAKSFAKVCIHQYFESISGEMRTFHHNRMYGRDGDVNEENIDDEEKLLGIRAQEDMNKVLWNWHTSKPALALRKDKVDAQSNGRLNGYVNGEANGFLNGHTPDVEKKEWAVYYSKV